MGRPLPRASCTVSSSSAPAPQPTASPSAVCCRSPGVGAPESMARAARMPIRSPSRAGEGAAPAGQRPYLQGDGGCRQGPVDDRVACGQLRRRRCERGVLGNRVERVDAGETLEQQSGAEVRQSLRQRRAGLVGADGRRTAGEDGAGVEAGVHLHDADPGDGVPGHDRPLDRRGAAPAGQEGGVHVDAAAGGRGEYGGGQQETVGGDHQDVQGADTLQFRHDSLGRAHRKPEGFGAAARGTGRRSAATARRAVRLREHRGDGVWRGVQGAQDAHGEVGSAGEPQREGAAQAFAASSRRCFSSFLRMRPRFRLDR